MPTYEYRCGGGHRTEACRPVAQRDEVAGCASCGAPATRIVSLPQRPISRPLGYSLRPGDRGYWDLETSHGRKAGHEQRRIEPFSQAAALDKAPPVPVDDAVPVRL